jgi:hypothetical protein
MTKRDEEVTQEVQRRERQRLNDEGEMVRER